MRPLPLFAAAVLALPAEAQLSSARGRINDLFGTSFEAERGAVSGAPALKTAAERGPLFTAKLWADLKAPDAGVLAELATAIDGLDASKVRTLPFARIDAILAEEVRREESALDLFTDDGLWGDRIYYVPADALRDAFDKYEIPVLSLVEGTAKDGRPFRMKALLMGNKRIDILYEIDRDADAFVFDNPFYPDHSYRSSARVTQRIQAPADLAVEGLWVDLPFSPRITRFVKPNDAPKTLRTEAVTVFKTHTQDRPVRPIRLRRKA